MGPIEHPNTPADENVRSPDGVLPHELADQVQLSFFDVEAPMTMNTTQPDFDSPEIIPQSEAVSNPAIEVPDSVPNSDTAAEFRAPASIDMPESLGSRLRAARETRGMRCEEVAHKLKLPLATVQALEADRYERIGEGIYLRGYLTKYLQLLELPRVLAERVLSTQETLPALTTSGTVSRPRYLFQRYSVSALYLILTGVIIVPAVLLAMRGSFEPSLAQITPLDAPEVVAPISTLPTNNGKPLENEAAPTLTPPSAAAPTTDESPLVASLTPFPATRRDANEGGNVERVVADKATTALSAGAHRLRLSLIEPSWVEIVANDGEKLEFGLLPAGAVRSYSSDKSIDVRLGNSTGAAIEIDGKTQDLTPFRHANVAHFKLSAGEASVSHSGG